MCIEKLLTSGRRFVHSLFQRTRDQMQPEEPSPFTRHEIISRCEYFTKTQLWPIGGTLHPDEWLDNFLPDEQEHAVHLLAAFLYYSEPMIERLFASAFQSLSTVQAKIQGHRDYLLTLSSSWKAFCDRAIITYVTGETPSPADSGYIFTRMARQVLSIDEDRILGPQEVLKRLAAGDTNPIVFVDDFVGSGQQFINTWVRSYDVGKGTLQSFRSIAAISTIPFYYCVPFCSELGLKEIERNCPEVVVSAAHILTNRYNVLHPDSSIWSDKLRPTAVNFVKRASLRAGIPDRNGNDVDDWQGYKKLGLALAFPHSIPDATLAFFRWDQNNWKPLMRKT